MAQRLGCGGDFGRFSSPAAVQWRQQRRRAPADGGVDGARSPEVYEAALAISRGEDVSFGDLRLVVVRELRAPATARQRGDDGGDPGS